MKAEIFIVRHGQTVGNRDHILFGQTETPLTDLGVQQALKAGQALLESSKTGAQPPFSAVYSSDTGRAVETARLILGVLQGDQGPLEIQRDQRLRERHLGTSETKTLEEHHKKMEADGFTGKDPRMYTPEGGESIQDAGIRFREFFDELCASIVENNLSRVLLVSHGALKLALLTMLTRDYQCSMPQGEEDKYKTFCPNTGITRLVVTFREDTKKLEALNCTTVYDGRHITKD